MVGVIVGCINNLAIDALISSLLNIASCQFEILKHNFAQLGSDIEKRTILVSSNKGQDEKYSHKNVNEELRHCIEHNLTIFK